MVDTFFGVMIEKREQLEYYQTNLVECKLNILRSEDSLCVIFCLDWGKTAEYYIQALWWFLYIFSLILSPHFQKVKFFYLFPSIFSFFNRLRFTFHLQYQLTNTSISHYYILYYIKTCANHPDSLFPFLLLLSGYGIPILFLINKLLQEL